MITIELTSVNQLTKITVECDECHAGFKRTRKNVRVSRLKHGRDLCQSCAARLTPKPQNTKEFWSDPVNKETLSKALKNSSAFKEAHAKVNRSGSNNPMFGKKASVETRAKMSKARTGKIGQNATAWKGGKNSLNKRVKKALQSRHKWFSRVLARAEGICEHCGGKAVDAHHVVPMITLIKSLLAETTLQTDDEKLVWLLDQELIVDPDLKNGLALCRECHKKAHGRWGSKVAP